MDFSSNKRPDDMTRITTPELADAFIEEAVQAVREQVGEGKVLLALSGGVDSSVVAALLVKAIGKQLTCVHVNHGLLRQGEPEQVVDVFRNQMDANLIYVDAVDRFLDKLAGVADGSSWRQPTSDMQRAIETLLASRNNHHKQINVIEGNYSPIYTIDGYMAFTINSGSLNAAATRIISLRLFL